MIDVKGLTVNDILNMSTRQINALDAKDLARVSGRLRSAANKRLRRLEKSGMESPAYRNAMRGGGSFSTKDKDMVGLRNEFLRMKTFMEAKTSTVRGAKQAQKKTVDEFKKAGVDIQEENVDRVMRLYGRLKEIDPSVSLKQFKYAVQDSVSKYVEQDMTDEEIIRKMKERIDELYEENQDYYQSSFSGAFEM